MPQHRQLPGPRPRKALGQHFLRDTGVLADVVAAVRPSEGGLVVEIGAGTGQLTEALLAAGHTVIALEIEDRLLAHLKQRFRGNPFLRLVQADARDVLYAELLPPGVPFVVVGNLPYFAANPIIRHLMESPRQPTEAVFMVQREVAREIAAKAGESSLLTISIKVYADAERLFDVPPVAFDPPPKVYSSVIRLKIRPEPAVPSHEITDFFTLVAKAFRNPRKQIHNALARETGLTAVQADESLRAANIDPMRRAETLSIDDWRSLLETTRAVKARG